jgi:UDP-glucose:glycoprotein glucosyltransferase
MHTPPSWIVRPESSPYDLDNLVLGNIHEPIHVAFNLKQLLIEGHAREASNAPPRGLQLQLTTAGQEETLDTQVMANLGYFQFKATPGVYQLSIRPGRGTEVFELESVGTAGWDSLSVNVTGTSVALTSFEGVTILPRFERKPGMEMANVLIDHDPVQQPSYAQAVFSRSVHGIPAQTVLMIRMKELVGLSPKPSAPAVPASRHADINIFTVASGLLYEVSYMSE